MNDSSTTTWSEILKSAKESDSFKGALAYSLHKRSLGHTIYPSKEHVFRAFSETPFEHLKVVILGQDPYHGANQAEGLCFSVPIGTPIPPSLQNIYKELSSDIGLPIPNHGHLGHWAREGVFLLNAVLTVESGIAGSHAGKGWEQFTDAVIHAISEHTTGTVFILWGNYARKKKVLIDESKHTILEAAHPSPLSAYNGFFGCKHFSKTNEALVRYGKSPIDWAIPDA